MRLRRLRPQAPAPGPPSGALDRITSLALGVLMAAGLTLIDHGRSLPSAGPRIRHLSHATRPTGLSRAAWIQVLKRTWSESVDDRVPAVAAGATFYALLALFPAVGAFVALYGLFAQVDNVRAQVAAMQGVLPYGAVVVLREQMNRLAEASPSSLGLTFAVTLGLLLMSSNAGSRAIIAGLNQVYDQSERRGFVSLNIVAFGFTLGGLVAMLAAAGAVAAVPQTLEFLGLSAFQGLSLLRWPAMAVVVLAMLTLLYRYGPSRSPRVAWPWVLPGALAATAGWILMSVVFSGYVARFGQFDRTYGSLGAVVGFMTWIWLSLIVVLVGAELNSELERQTTADTHG